MTNQSNWLFSLKLFCLVPLFSYAAPGIAGIAVLKDDSCNKALEQVKQRTRDHSPIADALRFDPVMIPQSVKDPKYPVSFRTKTRGISADGRCISLSLSPIFRIGNDEIDVKVGDYAPWIRDFNAFIALDKAIKPEDITSVNVLGHQVADNPTPDMLGGALSDMAIQAVVALSDETRLYFGGNKKEINGKPSKTAHLRYWLPAPKANGEPSLILCSKACSALEEAPIPVQRPHAPPAAAAAAATAPPGGKGDLRVVLTYSDKSPVREADEQSLRDGIRVDCSRGQAAEALLPKTANELIQFLLAQCVHLPHGEIEGTPSLNGNNLQLTVKAPTLAIEDIEVRLSLAKTDGPIPSDCLPVLEYWLPKGNMQDLKLEYSEEKRYKIKAPAGLDHLDARGAIGMRISDGSCALGPDDRKSIPLAEIRGSSTGKKVFEKQIFSTKPNLHVIFAFDSNNFKSAVITSEDIALLAKGMIKGLKQTVDSGIYRDVFVYSRLQEGAAAPRPERSLDASFFSGGSSSEKQIAQLSETTVAQLPRGSSARFLTARAIGDFIKSVGDTSSTLPDAPIKNVFVFVGRRETNPVCKGAPMDELIRQEKILADNKARAIVIDFYDDKSELVSASPKSFPHLEELKAPGDSSLPLYRCVDKDEKTSADTDSTAGVARQFIVNWTKINANTFPVGAEKQMNWLIEKHLDAQ